MRGWSRPDGNDAAQAAVADVYELRDFFEWRGLEFHRSFRRPHPHDAYASYDAERRFAVPGLQVEDPQGCQYGEVLKSTLKPWQCRMFGAGCTPETPLGALMVSVRGSCSAYYRYGGARAVEPAS